MTYFWPHHEVADPDEHNSVNYISSALITPAKLGSVVTGNDSTQDNNTHVLSFEMLLELMTTALSAILALMHPGIFRSILARSYGEKEYLVNMWDQGADSTTSYPRWPGPNGAQLNIKTYSKISYINFSVFHPWHLTRFLKKMPELMVNYP